MSDIQKGYICDVGAYSGGGEALYQLSNDLVDLGYNMSIVYTGKAPYNPPAKFSKYMSCIRVVNLDEVEHSENSFVIVPEMATSLLFHFPTERKYIYWLSFLHYESTIYYDPYSPNPIKPVINKGVHLVGRSIKNLYRFGRPLFPLDKAENLAGSWFVSNELTKRKIQHRMLIHSIGRDFLTAGMMTPDIQMIDRSNVVLYNPAKPSKIMNRLLERKTFVYVPIRGLNFPDLLKLFRTSKLYIDFGAFPGPERLPKETVFNGVDVLVGCRNAAATDDVLIPDKYKIKMPIEIETIESIIADTMQNYSTNYHDFDEFREMVADMERQYYIALNQIFSSK